MDQSSYIEKKVREWSSKYKLKLKTQGRDWTMLCPFHDDTKASLSIDKETGKWRCFGCGIGSRSFKDLIKKFNKEYGETYDYDSSSRQRSLFVREETKKKVKVSVFDIDDRIRAYFGSRGFSDKDVAKLEKEFILKEMVVNGRRFLRFDILDFDGNMVGWVRRSIDGEKLYLNKTGFDAERYFYGEWKMTDGEPLVCIEGPFDYYKTWLTGFNCLGTLNFEKASLKLARLRKKYKGKLLLYLFDADKNGSKEVETWLYYARVFGFKVSPILLDEGDPGERHPKQLKEIISSAY